ncbi:NADH-quinone oxidoreductase subunit C [Terricaulis sp.]|uniref:NADH-quinone oxidoreductase subunit C n=1 Tax=Terricaulis sp. TaxID=2768686 RepID=UPI002AC787FA|nr:NADH-quinone oxidoreductase subunit C [Terricaulis sp.]MDZ4690514.1 NADH-quinone oxidoreductase subunit C [Terricaulis sp.]
MSQSLEDLGAHIAASMTSAIEAHEVAFGELNLTARADQIYAVIKFLRDDPRCKFTSMIDICGVDYPERAKRFDVVYHLLSMQLNHRVRIRIATDEQTPVASVATIYPCADWFEREAFDMYGILFSNHPDLRRILTDYGFEGYPLRKDFPLSGHVEVRYDSEQQRVVYEPVKLAQAFRNFDFLSPWEGMTLPGDEKAGDGRNKP